jgi:hypothetical protein
VTSAFPQLQKLTSIRVITSDFDSTSVRKIPGTQVRFLGQPENSHHLLNIFFFCLLSFALTCGLALFLKGCLFRNFRSANGARLSPGLPVYF